MKYKEYLIKKDKLDLLSSLKALDKKLLNKALKESGMNSIEELKDGIIDEFETCLDMSKDDQFTRLYFERLLNHENSEWMSAYGQDIEDFLVFVYENGNHYSYYIPTEIKEIIYKLLGSMTQEEKFNLENAANTPIIKDLRNLLETLVVKGLRHTGDLFLINGLSNKPKKELINIIYNALTDEKKISEVIERFTESEFNLLKELMINKGTIQDNNISVEVYNFLYMIGIVFIFKRDNKFYISMTDDVYKTIKKIDLDKFSNIISENTKAYNLVRSMLELYGVVSYGDLCNCYNFYYGNGEDLDIPNNSLCFCDRYDNVGMIHTKHNAYFINKVLNNDKLESILEDIIERQNVIEKKSIKLDELLKYYDYNYYEETSAINEFKKYLKKKGILDTTIEDIIINIIRLYKLGHSFINVSLNFLDDCGVEITDDNLQEITNYLIHIYNNTRVWTNNGWTPIELGKNYKNKE